MSSKLQVFDNAEFGSIRTVGVNGEVMFVGKDIADILKYSNPRDAICKHVDNEDKDVAKCDTPGGVQNLTVINESGLYSLILRSKLPEAKKFKRWVTSEVLPSIRKHGMYAVDEIIANPDLLIGTLIALKEERQKTKKLEEENAVYCQQVSEMKPKASYYDIVLTCKNAVNISVIAKDYGWSARKMNECLHNKGVQFKQGNIWLLYQKYASCGYTKTNTHILEDKKGETYSQVHTKWTQKGRLFIYDLLKSDNIYPQIERGDE